ncbi:hypothetical protein BRADI_3g28833v3 [Brachypodium distachyon]|uniref:Uncharacterized protein n=1 Tax=Brachypodium distachyon TaxID=15368 RepID=A0A0Q3JFJ3_BRADI|nr:hypothetical protein BRADI_3g28833v3 [Brachypodium distachyon]
MVPSPCCSISDRRPLLRRAPPPILLHAELPLLLLLLRRARAAASIGQDPCPSPVPCALVVSAAHSSSPSPAKMPPLLISVPTAFRASLPCTRAAHRRPECEAALS